MIDVVSAVIIENGRVFLAQRGADKDFGFSWEAPGGKVDPVESHSDALRRELREELGVEVASFCPEPMWSGELHLNLRKGPAHIHNFQYLVQLAPESRPSLREGQLGMGWFGAAEVELLPLAPANERCRLYLMMRLRGRPIHFTK